jgi:hypothetical protein
LFVDRLGNIETIEDPGGEDGGIMRSSLGLSVVLVAALFAMVACGGQESNPTNTPSFSISGTPISLSESVSEFAEAMPVLDASIDDVCATDEPQTAWTCSCPGGGTARVRASENMYAFSLTFDDCTSSNGLSFNGTMDGVTEETTDSEGFDNNHERRVITYDLAEFGNCINVEGTVAVVSDLAEGTDECSGTLNANCNGEAVSCELSADCSSCI